MHEVEIKNMLRMAKEARQRSYAPYSHFHVGACLKAVSGAYYQGCNIENAAFTPTNCAERTAMFKAVYEGEREFEALAIIWDGEDYASPCGVCRQVLAEFCAPGLPVICANKEGDYKIVTLGELLPAAFTKKDMA
ncbi:MAG: cytidine deaminase [Eubacteriales bacterium]|nr:cytidine deaminase [Eubacteriales bacterium]